MSYSPFFKLEIFCPDVNVDEVLAALTSAGAGEIGNYDHCFTTSPIQGSFRPLEGANPASGEVGKLFIGGETKIEVNCREDRLVEAIQAVREVHPYEEPLINVIPMANQRYGGST